VTNPYATQTPELYDSQGNYHGNLSANPYDPNSVNNPYGRYGNPYSPESINNPYGAGNPYWYDSPSNPYGQGMLIYGAGNPYWYASPYNTFGIYGDANSYYDDN
jgi:hypothetical protein